MFDDFDVVRLGQKGMDGFGHHRPDIPHLQQLLGTGLQDGVQAAEMPRQILGRGLAHLADAEPKQEARQCGAFGFFQRCQQVLRRFLAHALERQQANKADAVQVGQGAHHGAIDQLVHQLFAQAVDVHGAAGGKVQQRFLALRRAKQATGAAVVGLAGFTHHGAAADGALARHAEVGHIHLSRRMSVNMLYRHPIDKNDFRSVS